MMDERGVAGALSLLREVVSKSAEVSEHVTSLLHKTQNGEFDTSKGISFLEMKYHVLLSYLTNLTYIILRKVTGQSINNNPAIDRLIELRTVLERIRPIDHKLKYQVDKVIKTASTGQIGGSNPLQYKANPENLVSKLDDDDSESDQDNKAEVKDKKPKKYVPPKLVPMHYDGDATGQERKVMLEKRAKERALSSSMMRDLRRQYDDAPEEIMESHNLHRLRDDKRAKERTEYEEANFLRMQISKKERSSMKKMLTMSSLGNLAQFDDITALTRDDPHFDADGLPSKKRKKGGKAKGKYGKKHGGSAKKKRRH